MSEADAENFDRGAQTHQGHHDVLRRGKLRHHGAIYQMGHLPTTGVGARAPCAPLVDPLLCQCENCEF